eukprot:6490863-Amphidinium_carterae.2
MSVSEEVIPQAIKQNMNRKAGLWRSWIRHHTYGMVGKPDMALLAHQYHEARNAGDPLLLELEKLSQAARVAVGAFDVNKKKSAFGETGKTLFRMATRLQRYSLWMRAHLQNPIAKAKMLAQHASACKDLSSAVSACRKLVRLDSALRRQQLEETLLTLKKYEKTHAATHKCILMKVLQASPWSQEDIVCLPCAGGTTFILPCQGNKWVTSGLAWADGNKQTNVASALEQEWFNAHGIVQEKDCTNVPESAAPKPCLQAGICLCSQQGKRLERMKSAIFGLLKTTFYAKSAKETLVSGQIVLQFHCPGTNTSAASSTSTEVAEQEHWFHVGHMSLNPYKPTFLVMHRHDDSIQPHSIHRLMLQESRVANNTQVSLLHAKY